MSDKHEKQIYLAMLAEQCGRYDDMKTFLEQMLQNRKEDFTADERNLLSLAYKHTISERRKAIRILLAYEGKEKKRKKSKCLEFIIEYKEMMIKEFENFCNGIIARIDNDLLPKAIDDEAKVLYYKMKGDYLRYIAENLQGDRRKEVADQALKAYQEGLDCAKPLYIIDPIRLGINLNYAVFHFEILEDKDNACRIAKEILDESKFPLEGKDEDDENHKDTFSLINLIRENMNMWNEENQDS